MIRRPPRSTRTDTLFPSTTLFRSRSAAAATRSCRLAQEQPAQRQVERLVEYVLDMADAACGEAFGQRRTGGRKAGDEADADAVAIARSEERRVGKECVSP